LLNHHSWLHHSLHAEHHRHTRRELCKRRPSKGGWSLEHSLGLHCEHLLLLLLLLLLKSQGLLMLEISLLRLLLRSPLFFCSLLGGTLLALILALALTLELLLFLPA